MVGPNNSGKTNALQALALWEIGLKHWLAKHGNKLQNSNQPTKRPGATISRLALNVLPVPTAKLLWHELRTSNNNIEIEVDGIIGGKAWNYGLEFYYANPESFYCRPLRDTEDNFQEIPPQAESINTAFLPPMSGIAANEPRLDPGTIKLRLGEGRTAEVLRNLWSEIYESRDNNGQWNSLVKRMEKLFGITPQPPKYLPDRGELTMEYKNYRGTKLDLASSGRGQQHTMLLLAYMTSNPDSVLLLDEPDAHLEILRQYEIYDIIRDTAAQTNSQLIVSSHSEAIIKKAIDNDIVISFIGKPHRISKTSAIMKALEEFGFEEYLQAEIKGWVLYLEGSTDLTILQQFAAKLNHPAQEVLERPFFRFVGNNLNSAKQHYYALQDANPDLVAIAIFDNDVKILAEDGNIVLKKWKQREIENYLCQRKALLNYANKLAREQMWGQGATDDTLFLGTGWEDIMDECITELEQAMRVTGEKPWSPEIKASDRFLNRLFENFCDAIELPDLIRKTHYHEIVDCMDPEDIDPEVTEKLDKIVEVANQAKPRT